MCSWATKPPYADAFETGNVLLLNDGVLRFYILKYVCKPFDQAESKVKISKACKWIVSFYFSKSSFSNLYLFILYKHVGSFCFSPRYRCRVMKMRLWEGFYFTARQKCDENRKSETVIMYFKVKSSRLAFCSWCRKRVISYFVF